MTNVAQEIDQEFQRLLFLVTRRLERLPEAERNIVIERIKNIKWVP
jgi:hypothetical protein